MTQLLRVALRGILSPHVRLATVKLCVFLSAISQKAINLLELAALQNDVRSTQQITDEAEIQKQLLKKWIFSYYIIVYSLN